MKKDYSNGREKGRLLASGRGQYSLMNKCYKNHWTDDNSILVVEDADDFDSKWKLYAVKGDNE